ncbi:alpha/beta hydrolase [Burkholderia cenocepacia]|uniref:Alpha/beta hydrolase n=4 Tax=Burkholderia cenocepacia TaxID=95486 RepID=A0ABD4UL73_9BURK|nr:alpha/beta hydrolase [Burkholderia cenocepacia]MCW3698867.1 alpha/beta hydrolase [Burkholderia cenocepacia]MCW3706812.1 alpha/beta hydrolase [Burkholderia cenocepacia]MCW3715130.1 alpha/beta hydrolase [Burkholderia cenocepacia]MCW3722827.1 alpha/beta hydrolase [Burkholderia cenocepacia]MCW3731103.1 alpha/beta hydrolase [Burkholderia cenocepacia]
MSWQSKFACWLLRWQFRPETMREVLDPARARRFTDLRMFVPRRPPSGYRLRQCYGAGDAPLRGEWLERTDTGAGRGPGRTLLYFHGGGYYFCSTKTHRPLVFGLTKRAGVRSFSLDYRLAPENRFPAALDDALAAYRQLMALGTPPESIVLGGDSAGGGLALATLVALRDRGEPLPAGAILFSPWTDLAGTGGTMRSNDGVDPMFAAAALPKAAKLYLGDEPATNPYASPLYADFTGLPPLYIQAGSTEVLLDDSRRVAEKAKAAGVQVEIEVWPDMPHVWQLYAPMVPEARDALDRAAAFLRRVAVERAVQRVGEASIA